MIVIHILAAIIGVVLLWVGTNGKLRGGRYDPATGEHVEDKWLTVMPAVVGAIILGSAVGGIMGV